MKQKCVWGGRGSNSPIFHSPLVSCRCSHTNNSYMHMTILIMKVGGAALPCWPPIAHYKTIEIGGMAGVEPASQCVIAIFTTCLYI